jgi:hypothetical protein
MALPDELVLLNNVPSTSIIFILPRPFFDDTHGVLFNARQLRTFHQELDSPGSYKGFDLYYLDTAKKRVIAKALHHDM